MNRRAYPATNPQLASRRLAPAPLGLALLEAIMGYEWLVSALNKLLSPTFRSGLAHHLHLSTQGNPNAWYVAFVTHWALPHAQICCAVHFCGPSVKQLRRAWQDAVQRGQGRLIRQITALLEVGTGGTVAQAAEHVGVSVSTVYRWLQAFLLQRWDSLQEGLR